MRGWAACSPRSPIPSTCATGADDSNRAAVGWTRTPLHRPNLRGWGRTKRWEYWGLVTETHVVGLTISSLDYAGVEAVYVLDRATGQEIVHEATVPLARGVLLSPRCGVGRSSVDAGGVAIAVDDDGGRHPDHRARAPDVGSTSSRPARRVTSRSASWCRGRTGCSSTPSRTSPGH